MAIASEGKMRAEARQYISGDNLRTELTPFTFSLREKNSNTIEIRNVPMAYVVDLWRKIEDMLISNDNESTGYNLCVYNTIL